MVHMSFGVSEGGVRESTKKVCRNLIKSMPRWIQAVIEAKQAQTTCMHKNWFIKCGSL